MKKQSEKFDSILKKVVQHMVDTELYGWPPQCTHFTLRKKELTSPVPCILLRTTMSSCGI